MTTKEYLQILHKSDVMNKEEILNELLKYFINENQNIQIKEIPSDYMGKRKLLRALMNIREAEPMLHTLAF